MKGTSPVSRDASPSAPLAPGSVDPLDTVTDLDTRADSEGLGLFKGTPHEGILRTNDEFLAVTGLNTSTARGWDWMASVHADDRDRLRRSIDAACASGARSAFPVRMQVRLGVIESLRVVIGATPAAGGDPVFVGLVQRMARPNASTTIDPDAREHASAVPGTEAATVPAGPVADDVSDPYRVLVDAVPQPIAYAAPDGTLEFANPAWVACTGVDVDADLRAALGLDAPDGIAALRLAMDTAVPWSGRCRIGGRATEVAIAPVAAELGGGFVVTLTEPTALEIQPTNPVESDAADAPADRLAAQIALCERLVAAAPDYAAVLGPEGEVISLNGAARRLLGLDADADLSGLFAYDLARFADTSESIVGPAPPDALLEHGYLVTEGTLAVGPDEGRPVGLLLFALRREDDGLGAVLCIARDDTAMHDARERIAQSERWYRALVQHSADIVAVVSEDLRRDVRQPGVRRRPRVRS